LPISYVAKAGTGLVLFASAAQQLDPIEWSVDTKNRSMMTLALQNQAASDQI
jgi:hypothetical protein